MIRQFVILLGVLLFAGIGAAQDTTALKNQTEKRSYALGMDLGTQLKKMSIEVDPAFFGQGLKDALSGSKTVLTPDEAHAIIAELQSEMMRKQAELRRGANVNNAEMAAQAAINRKAGDAFMAENRKKEGVVTLPNGLQYKILKEGNGMKPTPDDTVTCHYRGTFIDGKEFSDSYKINQPFTRPVKGVIKGWAEALPLMAVGSKWQLFIPPELAYGEAGAGSIGPSATLIFEVELISIQDKRPTP